MVIPSKSLALQHSARGSFNIFLAGWVESETATQYTRFSDPKCIETFEGNVGSIIDFSLASSGKSSHHIILFPAFILLQWRYDGLNYVIIILEVRVDYWKCQVYCINRILFLFLFDPSEGIFSATIAFGCHGDFIIIL